MSKLKGKKWCWWNITWPFLLLGLFWRTQEFSVRFERCLLMFNSTLDTLCLSELSLSLGIVWMCVYTGTVTPICAVTCVKPVLIIYKTCKNTVFSVLLWLNGIVHPKFSAVPYLYELLFFSFFFCRYMSVNGVQIFGPSFLQNLFFSQKKVSHTLLK